MGVSAVMTNLSTKELLESIDSAHRQGMQTIAYLPVGCMEQHGPFLPLESDSLIAEEISRKIAVQLANTYFGYVLPAISYTPSQSNSDYCGTVSIKDDSFRLYAKAVCSSIMNSPFDALVIICGHGGAECSLREVGYWIVNEQYSKGQNNVRPVLVTSIYEASSIVENRFNQKPGRHADWREFLLLYYILGDKYFTDSKIEAMKTFQSDNSFKLNPSKIYGMPMQYRSVEGILGDPMPAHSEDWSRLSSELWDLLVNHISNEISNELEAFGGFRKVPKP
jgi:creatinine amidohydrolase/Fe(II)-dependent formamide hydrolase-like protein